PISLLKKVTEKKEKKEEKREKKEGVVAKKTTKKRPSKPEQERQVQGISLDLLQASKENSEAFEKVFLKYKEFKRKVIPDSLINVSPPLYKATEAKGKLKHYGGRRGWIYLDIPYKKLRGKRLVLQQNHIIRKKPDFSAPLSYICGRGKPLLIVGRLEGWFLVEY
ncbi:hypothetical protein ACFL35_09360, partial [Candidatus Riflebacteria bacterium]